MNEPDRPDKQRMREAFEQAADHYDEVAVLQREVGSRLLERLELFRHQPQQILDIGAGTGFCSLGLAKHYGKARIISLDIAHGMVRLARNRFPKLSRRFRGHGFVCGDAEILPFASDSFDLLFSNLTLQWCTDLEQAFREFRRVLKPGGLLLFSTLGPDTLKELRHSWAEVDGEVHVNRFTDMHDVGDALVHARFGDPVMDMEQITFTYRDSMTLMRDLKELGAHNVNPGRYRGMTGKGKLKAVNAAYEKYRMEDGQLPATYEVVYGHAWRPETESATAEIGEARIPIEQLKHTSHNREDDPKEVTLAYPVNRKKMNYKS